MLLHGNKYRFTTFKLFTDLVYFTFPRVNYVESQTYFHKTSIVYSDIVNMYEQRRNENDTCFLFLIPSGGRI